MYIVEYKTMRIVFLGVLFIGIISCKNENANVSKCKDLEVRVLVLEDSLKALKNYYHFSKIRPVVYPADAGIKEDGVQVFKGLLAADGMVIGADEIHLQIESLSENTEVNKIGGFYEIRHKSDLEAENTINLSFKFKDPRGESSMVFPVEVTLK